VTNCLAIALWLSSSEPSSPCKTTAAVEEIDRVRDEAFRAGSLGAPGARVLRRAAPQVMIGGGKSMVFTRPKANGWS
jgi:hypothetical protein